MEQQISIVTVRANTKKLIQTLKFVKVAIGKPTTKNIVKSAEITVTDGKFTIAAPGAIFYMDCITQGTCKASVLFLHFMQIVKDLKSEETLLTVTEGSLRINSVTIPVKTTFFEDDNILRTIDLPINYTESDLIRLDNSEYTPEEIEFNNLDSRIELANRHLEDNIWKAYELINQYGVRHAEVEKMVYSKLFSKT